MSSHWRATKSLPDFPPDAVIDINPWRRRNPSGPASNSGYEFFVRVLLKKYPMTVAEAVEFGKEIGLTEREVQLHLKWYQTWVNDTRRKPVQIGKR
jgi:hypothetical protein